MEKYRYQFVAQKCGGRWAVLCRKSNNYNFLGKGKRFCTKMAKTLNSYNEKDVVLA